MSTLLDVQGLTVTLPTNSGPMTVVDDVDYAVEQGQVFGVAGESGSGKTISVLALMRLLPAGSSTSGTARYGGQDLLKLRPRALREVRGAELAMVFQDPLTSLHPMLSIGKQLTEHVRSHEGASRSAASKRAVELLEEVRIPDPEHALRGFPHQFSGGILTSPRHPYTRALLDALPHPEAAGGTELVAIPGSPPTPRARPAGCAFHPRCPYASEQSRVEVPPLVAVSETRLLACHVDPFRPK